MDWKIFIEYESNAFAALFKEKSVSQSAETTSEDSSEKELKAKEAILGICVQRIENAKSFAQSLVGFACKNSLDSCLFPFFKQASDIYEEKFTCLSDLLKNGIRYTDNRIVEDLKKSFNDYYNIFFESPLGSDVKTLTLKEEVVLELPQYAPTHKASKTVLIYAVPSDATFPRELPIISGSLTYKDLMNGLKGARILSELKAIVDSDGVFHMVCDDQDAAVLAANQMKPIVLLSHSNRRTSNVGAMMEIQQSVSSYLVDCIVDLAEKHFQKPIHLWPYIFNVGALFDEKGLLTSFFDSNVHLAKSNVHFLLPALTANQVYSRCKGQGLKMCVEQMAHIKIDASCSDLAKKAVEKAVVSSMHPWQNLKIDQLLVTKTTTNPKIKILVVDEPICPLESSDIPSS